MPTTRTDSVHDKDYHSCLITRELSHETFAPTPRPAGRLGGRPPVAESGACADDLKPSDGLGRPKAVAVGGRSGSRAARSTCAPARDLRPTLRLPRGGSGHNQCDGGCPRGFASAGESSTTHGGHGARPRRGGARGRARAVAQPALRGPRARRGLRHAPRRGRLPLLRADDVPAPGRARRGAGAPRPAPAPAYAARSCWPRRPNEVWSWDITKLLGPAKWTYYYLYVMLDVFSRYVVGWMVAHARERRLAERLIAETCAKQGIGRRSSPCTPTAAAP